MANRSAGIVVAAFCTTLIAYAIRYGYGMLLPDMINSMGISKTGAGTIYSSYFLSYTLFSPLLGWLSDRYNIRIIMTCFTLLLASGAFLMAYATSVFSASCFFVIAGIGHAACWAPVMALVQRAVPDRKRGMALSITSMGSAVGIAGLSLVLPAVVSHYTWRGGWMVMGMLGFCVSLLNGMLIQNLSQNKESTSEKQEKKDKEFNNSDSQTSPNKERSVAQSEVRVTEEPYPIFMTYTLIMRNRALWFIGTSYLLVGFSVLVPYTFLSAYATEQLNLSFADATSCFTIMAVAGIAGKLTLGYLSDIARRVYMMMICALLLGMGCLGIAVFETVGMICISATLFGFGFGAVWPIYAAAAPDFFPAELSGSVIGLWTGFMGVGSILSPTLCGWSIDKTDGYTMAFTMGTVCAVGAALFLLPVRQELSKSVK